MLICFNSQMPYLDRLASMAAKPSRSGHMHDKDFCAYTYSGKLTLFIVDMDYW